MTKSECLELLKLLSALESWSFASQQERMPDYLSDRLTDAIEVLTKEVLK